MTNILLIVIFALGYSAIILEHILKINKSAVAIFMAVACWAVFFLGSPHSWSEDIAHLNLNVSGVAQIIFFFIRRDDHCRADRFPSWI